MPWTPWARKVFRSAWMPAPPPESDPAIVNTRAGTGTGDPPSPRHVLPGRGYRQDRPRRVVAAPVEAPVHHALDTAAGWNTAASASVAAATTRLRSWPRSWP